MDDSGYASIADFAEATVVKDEDYEMEDGIRPTFAPQWTAPEVLKEGSFCKKADIFSFAMVVVEVRRG